MTDRITRLEDLAALAGVSTATASRALADGGSVGAATRQRVLRLARAHGYRGPRADPVGEAASPAILLVAGPDDAIARHFAEALVTAAGAARIIVNPSPTADDAARIVRAHRADGVVIVGDGGLHDSFNMLAGEGEHFVVWGAKRADQSYCCVGPSDALAGRRAMLHLARGGRRRIAYVGNTRSEGVMQHYRGYLDAHDSAGLSPDPALLMGEAVGFDGARDALAGLLARGTAIDGVVAADDVAALGAVRALATSGRSIPGDIAVIGYGELSAGAMATPALSTLSCDVAGAAARIVAALGEAGALRSERLAADVIIRKSCGGEEPAPLSAGA